MPPPHQILANESALGSVPAVALSFAKILDVVVSAHAFRHWASISTGVK